MDDLPIIDLLLFWSLLGCVGGMVTMFVWAFLL